MLSPEELSALYLSAKVASVATLCCLPFAICLGWMLARYEFRSKFLLEAMLQLLMVLPPVVLGYVLLVLFSPQGWIGQVLAHWGIELAFNWKGAVLAAMLVAFPLLVQPIRLSFQMLNPQLEQVAASLGAAPLKVFFSISLPLVLPGILWAVFWALAAVWVNLAPPLPLLGISRMKPAPFPSLFIHSFNSLMAKLLPCVWCCYLPAWLLPPCWPIILFCTDINVNWGKTDAGLSDRLSECAVQITAAADLCRADCRDSGALRFRENQLSASAGWTVTAATGPDCAESPFTARYPAAGVCARAST